MKKKTLLKTAFISALLASVLVETTLVNLGRANPYIKGGKTPPPEDIQPPAISIFSPNNNTVYDADNITLTFNVTTPEDTYKLIAVYFEVDWQEGNISVYYSKRTVPDCLYIKNLTGIPEGKHMLTITAVARGSYIEGYTGYSYDINGSASVYFSIEKISGETFPNTPIAAASIVGAVVLGVSLVYFKKRKR